MQKPNIVCVLTDDQGYGDLGCHGNTIIQTPYIDSFYYESVRLTNYHVGPTCAPTRAGLLTGRYANSTGVWHTVGGRSLLRDNEYTLAQALTDHGYITGIFGKWHLGDAYPYRPQDRGFSKTVIHGGGGISQTPDYWGNDYFDDTYFDNGTLKKFKGYCTDVFFSEALQFIDKHKEEPFFCYITPNAPHTPLNVENHYADMYRGTVDEIRARFYGMITNIDQNFGRLIDKLQDLGLYENTIVIFMTDNGTDSGVEVDANGFVTYGYNAGLRGKKCSEYDGGHRVPCFIRYPAGGIGSYDVGKPTGKDIDTLTANIDIMPTLLSFCGIGSTVSQGSRTNQGQPFHGIDISKLLSGKKLANRVVVTDSQRVAYPQKWKQSAVMTNQWRLINGKELYDMSANKEQRNNVAEMYPKVVKNLREEYERWWNIVSEQYDLLVPISIGRQATKLTNHDLRNDSCNTAWNQKLIRQGLATEGYWEVYIEQAETYRFEVMRWPQEAATPIAGLLPPQDVEIRKDCIQPSDYAIYEGSTQLMIDSVRISVGDIIQEVKVAPNDTVACVEMILPEGYAPLRADFYGSQQFITSAYYVYVSLIDTH